MSAGRITFDDVAQFDARLQTVVLTASAHVYAAGLRSSKGSDDGTRHHDARRAVEDWLDQVSPLILGSRGD